MTSNACQKYGLIVLSHSADIDPCLKSNSSVTMCTLIFKFCIYFIYTDLPDGSPRTCTIISTSLPTVTTPSGVIASGTQNVILYCICNSTNIAVGPTFWFFNDVRVTLTQDNGSGNPYARSDSVPGPLIIPSFFTDSVGTYRCRSDGNFISSPGDRITLTVRGMFYFQLFVS